jgi:hypothetical protein
MHQNTAALEALVGEWTLEAGPPGGPLWPGEARVTFAWSDEAPLLFQRWQIEMPEAPNGVSVIGCDAENGSYYQLYTDDRDVQRIYAMSLADGVWKLWRDGAPFSQRFTGTFSEDGNTITGQWELARDGTTWETDFNLTYRKVR